MKDEELMWYEKEIVETKRGPLFEISTVRSIAQDGTEARFIKVTPPDWVTVIPVLPDGRILMVRQYRHGSATLSDEFPAGVIDPGEKPIDAAIRELEEETGYVAGNIISIGQINPNPAFMTNISHTYLAENLRKVSDQNLDDHERIEYFSMSEEEIFQAMGKENMNSAIMVQAWYWYQQQKRSS
jgi:ADP-ribose pyrophosphatase